jgi:uncharacterized integral membrane protein
MNARTALAFLAISVVALILMGVNYVLNYLGTDVYLNFYPWGEVSVQRLLRNTAVFALAMVGWLITLFALILGIFQLNREESW